MEVSTLNGPFRAFNPNSFCDRDEAVLLHYVKNELQSVYMQNYAKFNKFCDSDYVEEWNTEQKNKKAEKKIKEEAKKLKEQRN